MDRENRPSINNLDAALLFRLWRRRRDGDGSLFTARDLQDWLQDNEPTFRQGLKLRTVQRTLERMENEGLLEGGAVPRDTGLPGPNPRGYKLAPDPHIVQWRSTALILVSLLHHTNSPVEEGAFINEIVAMGEKEDNGQLLTEQSVQNQIAWAVGKKYIHLDETGSNPGSVTQQRRVSATALVNGELRFLERMIDRKNPGSRTQTLPSASGSGNPGAGRPRP